MSKPGLKEQVIAAAQADAAFRAHLLRDPRAAISGQFKVALPAHLQIAVVQDTADTVTIVLPLLPDTGRLPDDLLDAVAGGNCGNPTQCSNSSPGGLQSPNPLG